MLTLTRLLAEAARTPLADESDGRLLQRSGADDHEAFTELVRRHAGLVWRTCRLNAGDNPSAEDAFQATFLALFRHAGSIRRGDALAGWLHRTARRAAIRARRSDETLPSATPFQSSTDPLDQLTVRELLAAVDEEIDRLPEQFRAPLLLCGVEGMSQHEAARQLGWTLGSLKGRLERGRAALRKRLEGRGLAVPAGLFGLLGAAGAVPAGLLDAVQDLARSEAISPTVSTLACEITAMKTSWMWKSAILLVLAAGGVMAALLFHGKAQQPAAPLPIAAPVPQAAQNRFAKDVQAARKKAIDYLKKQQGTWEGGNFSFLADMEGGFTALAVLSLLEAGVSPDDPAITNAVTYLAKLPPKKTYVVSLQTQVLARVDLKKHAKLIQGNADWLMKSAIRQGKDLVGWSYPGNTVADGSNTHFGVLGLHAAAKAGAKIDAAVWSDIEEMYVKARVADGWPYHANGIPVDRASHSMTAAALCGLAVASAHIKQPGGAAKGEAAKAADAGWAAFLAGKGSESKSLAYMLLVTAELGRLSGKDVFQTGKKKVAWYRDGAEKLVKEQQKDGSWTLGKGVDANEIYSTACALYFLGPPEKPPHLRNKECLELVSRYAVQFASAARFFNGKP